jgi:hypothetical protein
MRRVLTSVQGVFDFKRVKRHILLSEFVAGAVIKFKPFSGSAVRKISLPVGQHPW